jgi:hypothetical protein
MRHIWAPSVYWSVGPEVHGPVPLDAQFVPEPPCHLWGGGGGWWKVEGGGLEKSGRVEWAPKISNRMPRADDKT